MRQVFTPRRRIVALLALACLVGYYYLAWAWPAVKNMVRYQRYGMVICSGTWRDVGMTGCRRPNSYSLPWSVVEVAGVSVLLVVAGWLLARWALWPLRGITDTVARLGPNSLGLRLATTGPRDETRRLSDAIDAMLARVADGYQAQRSFAANASHELRTPLATQRALIEVSLADGELDPSQLRLLGRQLLATNERNAELVEGLLVLAETERGLMSHTDQRLDTVVGDAAGLLRPAATKAGVTIGTELAPATVPGERPLLERLAVNLIGNAVKYNVTGGSVHVRVEPPGALTVANTGPVVAAEQVSGLFEPFRRAGVERLDHHGGVGLGLTIVRSIVAAHDGALDARANPAGGLTIDVRLPAAR